MRRPKLYPKPFEDALELIRNGSTIAKAAEAIGMDRMTFMRNVRKDPEYKSMFLDAMADSAHIIADELQTVFDKANTMPAVQKARGISDNLKWIASRRNPANYGDRMQVDHTHTIDLSKVLELAAKRVEKLEKQPEVIEIKPEIKKITQD